MRVIAVEHEPEGEAPAGLLLEDKVDAERDKERAHGSAAYDLHTYPNISHPSIGHLPTSNARAVLTIPTRCLTSTTKIPTSINGTSTSQLTT